MEKTLKRATASVRTLSQIFLNDFTRTFARELAKNLAREVVRGICMRGDN